MSAPAVERLLARLYTDEGFHLRFLAAPLETAIGAGLDAAEAQAVSAIDRDGLVLAAHSYACKRAAHADQRGRKWLGFRRQGL